MFSCKCPFCTKSIKNIKDHTTHIQQCQQNSKIPKLHTQECSVCKTYILKQEFEPLCVSFKLYIKYKICWTCKYRIMHENYEHHVQSCKTKIGPSILCQGCKQKDLNGIIKRMSILEDQSLIKICPNCFSPSQKLNGCQHVVCNACGQPWNYDVSRQVMLNGNINDQEIHDLLGIDVVSGLSTLYTRNQTIQNASNDKVSLALQFNSRLNNNTRVLRRTNNTSSLSPVSQSSDNHSCSLRSEPQTQIVFNDKQQEKPSICEICYTNPNPIMLQPCKHWCCVDCIVKTEKQVCPFCRSNILLFFLTNKGTTDQ